MVIEPWPPIPYRYGQAAHPNGVAESWEDHP